MVMPELINPDIREELNYLVHQVKRTNETLKELFETIRLVNQRVDCLNLKLQQLENQLSSDLK